jgi:hypothetical protein
LFDLITARIWAGTDADGEADLGDVAGRLAVDFDIGLYEFVITDFAFADFLSPLPSE